MLVTDDDIQKAIGTSLKHYGIRGMRWGVRRTDAQIRAETPVVAVVKKGSSQVKTSGGTGSGPSDDVVKVAVARQKMKASGINALSNAELKAITDRMNMERNFAEAVGKLPPKHPGRAMVKKMIKEQGKSELNGLITGKTGTWTKRIGLLLTTTQAARKAPAPTLAALGARGAIKTGAKAVKGAFQVTGGKHRK
jgi:hypothetical protein